MVKARIERKIVFCANRGVILSLVLTGQLEAEIIFITLHNNSEVKLTLNTRGSDTV